MSEKNQQIQELDQSYWAIVKRQFKKNRLAVWSLRVVYVIVFIGVFANFIANDKPYYCKYDGKTYFPVFKEVAVNLGVASWPSELVTADWKKLELESAIWPIIPYSSKEFDRYNVQHKSPFGEQRNLRSWRWRHWMGTDEIGRDVMAGMIYGTRIAMLVGVVSMSIATFIGIVMGAFAGYFGDERLKMSLIRVVLNVAFIYPAFFYSFGVRSSAIADSFSSSIIAFLGHLVLSLAIFVGVMAVPNVLSNVLKKVPLLSKKVNVPVDIIISRTIEVIISIPGLLLILSIVAIVKPSIMIVMVVIGLTSWTGIARFARGELLRVRNLEYITAAQSLGFSEFRTIFRHALPNALTSVLISVAFGVAGAILTESFLSFLGIGVQADVITWGKLLNFSRSTPEAWWLAIFPGFAIFITVTIFNLLGEGLNDALDPRLK
jgi:peptide/nickel transport system permease protein